MITTPPVSGEPGQAPPSGDLLGALPGNPPAGPIWITGFTRPDRCHHPRPAVNDTPENSAARANDNPEHTSSKNPSRSSYETLRLAIHNTTIGSALLRPMEPALRIEGMSKVITRVARCSPWVDRSGGRLCQTDRDLPSSFRGWQGAVA
ncbi:MAG: hypothetical protein JWM36_4911 [Hyphomicrobiales bacterium]|jgi:hypothetical protein|nr:hypothetical protein [Hyphomicrobiales bacterium]